jgi:hypothetical protein
MYSSYRQEILKAASLSGLQHLAVPLDSQCEGLFTDYFFTPDRKSRCLVHLSGVHGVEGYLGSLIQRRILEQSLSDLPFQLVIVHALNPAGMDRFQRTNPQNVDLNRNSLDSYDLQNPNFVKFKDFLDSGSSVEFLKLIPVMIQLGLGETVQTVSRGQSQFPDSLFFSGQKLQPELISLVEILKQMTAPDTRIYTLDVHTGLGKFGQEMLILDGFDNRHEKEFFESSFQCQTVIPGQSSASYRADGPLSVLMKKNWQAYHLFQEFGTFSTSRVLKALISRDPQRMLKAFFPEDPQWREHCTSLGVLRFQQLARALSSF